MPAKRHKVKVGSTTLEVYPRTDPQKGQQWRFAYQLPGSQTWRYKTYTDLTKAKHEAKEIGLKIAQGTVSFEHLTPQQQTLCTKLLNAKITEPELERALILLESKIFDSSSLSSRKKRCNLL